MKPFHEIFRGFIAKYPYTDYERLNLDWLINAMQDAVELAKATAADQVELRQYVETYFSQLSVPDEVKAVIDQMKTSGEFTQILEPIVDAAVGDLNERVAEAEGAITTNEQDIAALKTRAASAEGRLTTAENRLNDLTRPQKLVLIGDSYTVDNMTPNFSSNMANAGISFSQAFKQGGTGCWDNSWATAVNAMSAASDVTDVVVMSMYNDWYNLIANGNVTVQQLKTNIQSFKAALRAKFPNATTHLFFVGNNLSPAAAGRFERKAKYDCFNAYASLEDDKFRIVPGSWSILLNVNDVQSDGLHPTASGSALMCSLIAESIKKNFAPIERHETRVEAGLGLSYPSASTRVETDWIQQSINGNEVSMEFQKLYIEWPDYNQQAWQPDQQAVNALEILDVATPLVTGSLYPWSFSGETSCVIRTLDGTQYEAACRIIMLQDKLYLRHSNTAIPKDAFLKSVLVESVRLSANAFDVTT